MSLNDGEKMVVLDDGSGMIGKFNTYTKEFFQLGYYDGKINFSNIPLGPYNQGFIKDYIKDATENAAQALLDLANQGGGRRKRKARRSRKLKRSNKSRLNSRSKKSRSKSVRKSKKVRKSLSKR